MTRFDRDFLERAFVPRSAPNFADCILRIQGDDSLDPFRRRDLASGLRLLAEAMQSDPATTPADPTWLQPRIAAIAPVMLDLKPKTWANILSNARTALATCGVVEKAIRLNDLSPLWAAVWQEALDSGILRVSRCLGRFVRFLDNLGVAPSDVTADEATLYRAALEVNELHKSPEESMRQAVRAWNIAVERIAGWPGRPIHLAPRGNCYALPLSRFPESFRQDLDWYRRRLEAPDLLDPNALPAPLRPHTVAHRLAQLRRFASAVVHSGVPVAALISIAALLQVERVRAGLEWLLARQGGESSPGLSDLCTMIVTLARHHVDVGACDLLMIETYASRLHVDPCRGMTEKNRDRLRQLDDPAVLGKLLGLTDRHFFPGGDDGSVRAAARREVALAIAILLRCPIRIKNLASIHIERNLQRTRDGRAFLRFLPDEVKNRRFLEFELPEELIATIDAHLATRAPRLCAQGTPWLFARRDSSGPAEKNALSQRIATLIWHDVGITFNAHLFRHFAAMLWLNANPGQYEVVRRLLGHSAVSSTVTAYTEFSQSAAAQLYADVLRKSRTRS